MRSPGELVRIGLARSRVVIVNECHDGDRHCPRTREIGRRLLPVGYEAGVRHLAMEALFAAFAEEANRARLLPEVRLGYLGQEDMRALMGDALSLGLDLVAYECDFSLWQGSTRTAEFGNWRDAEEARNLTKFLAHMPGDTRLLVWCGNSHQRKTPQSYPGVGRSTWIRSDSAFAS